MSVLIDSFRHKTQRFLVTFKGIRSFHNTESHDGALALARTKLLGGYAAVGGEPDADLATLETYKKVASAKASLRY